MQTSWIFSEYMAMAFLAQLQNVVTDLTLAANLHSVVAANGCMQLGCGCGSRTLLLRGGVQTRLWHTGRRGTSWDLHRLHWTKAGCRVTNMEGSRWSATWTGRQEAECCWLRGSCRCHCHWRVHRQCRPCQRSSEMTTEIDRKGVSAPTKIAAG